MKKFLNILIFFIILSRKFGALSEDNFDESSIFKIRKKRLIHNSPHLISTTQRIPYIVNIHRNGVSHCGGSILLPTLIITAAHCFIENAVYTILSGSVYANYGIYHHIERKIEYPNFHPRSLENDIALVIITPPISIRFSYNSLVALHSGTLAPNAHGTFSGWGCTHISENGFIYPEKLQSMSVPLISEKDCQEAYPKNVISNREICTFDEIGKSRSCNGDSGGPLVVDGELLGILSWGAANHNDHRPDVFVNLAYPEHRHWILFQMHTILRK